MIEFGHFRELRNILDRVNGAQVTGSSPGRRTMVFSATLTVGRRTTERKKKKKTTSSQESIGEISLSLSLSLSLSIYLSLYLISLSVFDEPTLLYTTSHCSPFLYRKSHGAC